MLAVPNMVGSFKNRPRHSARVGLGLVAALVQLAAGAGASHGAGPFDGDSPLPIVLEAPWRTILRDRESRPVESGRLVLGESSETVASLDVQIKLRGRWRLENCSRPPLTVTLPAEPAATTILGGQTVLHLTPQCHQGDRFRQHLVEEYLVFRAYGLLTPTSLRARLVSLVLRDPTSRRDPWTGLAILVEDIGLAAERLGLRWSETKSIGPGKLDPDAAALFALFQYMIGHTDWSLVKGPGTERCCHNAALLEPPDRRDGFLPVPYDFDASGLVDTGEISPADRLPIEDVRQRLYRGFCVHNPRVPIAAVRLRRARPELEALIENAELLTPRTRKSSERFLAEFFEIVDDPKKLESKVLARCR